jgi:hypothetical protein
MKSPPRYWDSVERDRCGFRANTVSQLQIVSVRIRTAPGTWRWPVLTWRRPIFSPAENPHGHFLSSACGHNKDVFYCRVELTRRGHNFNCAAGAVGSFYLGRRPHPNGFFAASTCLENGGSESETGVVLGEVVRIDLTSAAFRQLPRCCLGDPAGGKNYWLSRSHFPK